MSTRTGRGRAMAMVIVVGGWALGAWVVTTSPVGASPTPLSGRFVFAQTEAIDPLVIAAAVDNFAAFDGTDLAGWRETTGLTWTVHTGALFMQTGAAELNASPLGVATVPTAFNGVLVRADLEFPTDDRSAGVVLNRGPSGDLHVLVERDGADQRAALYLDEGPTATMLEASTPAGGLPPSARLVVEDVEGILRVWLDGSLVIQRTLVGAEVQIAQGQDHGIVIAHPGDRVAGFRVLAPT